MKLSNRTNNIFGDGCIYSPIILTRLSKYPNGLISQLQLLLGYWHKCNLNREAEMSLIGVPNPRCRCLLPPRVRECPQIISMYKRQVVHVYFGFTYSWIALTGHHLLSLHWHLGESLLWALTSRFQAQSIILCLLIRWSLSPCLLLLLEHMHARSLVGRWNTRADNCHQRFIMFLFNCITFIL